MCVNYSRKNQSLRNSKRDKTRWDSQWPKLVLRKQVLDFPGSSVVKNLPDNAGDTGLINGLERSPGEGNSNLLQFSSLGNPMDRGAWWATAHGGLQKSWKQRLNNTTKQSLMHNMYLINGGYP